MKRCPIAAVIAGSIGILPCCVFTMTCWTRGMNVCPISEGPSQPPYFGKIYLVPITACTCITYFTGWQKRREKKSTSPHRFWSQPMTRNRNKQVRIVCYPDMRLMKRKKLPLVDLTKCHPPQLLDVVYNARSGLVWIVSCLLLVR